MLVHWMSPFLPPQAVRDCTVTDVGFGAVSIVSSIVALQQLYEGKEEIMAGRNKAKGSPSPPPSEALQRRFRSSATGSPTYPGPSSPCWQG